MGTKFLLGMMKNLGVEIDRGKLQNIINVLQLDYALTDGQDDDYYIYFPTIKR